MSSWSGKGGTFTIEEIPASTRSETNQFVLVGEFNKRLFPNEDIATRTFNFYNYIVRVVKNDLKRPIYSAHRIPDIKTSSKSSLSDRIDEAKGVMLGNIIPRSQLAIVYAGIKSQYLEFALDKTVYQLRKPFIFLVRESESGEWKENGTLECLEKMENSRGVFVQTHFYKLHEDLYKAIKESPEYDSRDLEKAEDFGDYLE